MKCSTCGGPRGDDNCIHHLPGCDFYTAKNMFAEHPDLVKLEEDIDYWLKESSD